MRLGSHIRCGDFPCADVNRRSYAIPRVDLDPLAVSIIMISEASPPAQRDGYYASNDSLFARTTLQAFADAGAQASCMQDLIRRGLYFTTAVKCGKQGYAVRRATIDACSALLEKELSLFPRARVIMLMGDVAITALNLISKRQGQGRVVPAGSTYKIRSGTFAYHGMRVFPSYLQAGPSFFIEKSKRTMIAQDIAAALSLVEESTTRRRATRNWRQ
jgi:uracil-DNA glycosylase